MTETSIIDFRGFAPLPFTHEVLASRAGYANRFKSFDVHGGGENVAARLALLDRLGIACQVVSGAGAPIADLKRLVDETHRLVPIAEISPTPCMQSVAMVRDAAASGLRLIGLTPYREGFSASDRRFYPIYAACCELGLGIVLHASTHFSRSQSMSIGHPIHLDQVAIDFPELMLVASHGGWPWVDDMVAVATRHPNIYVELSGQRTKYYGSDAGGWAALFSHARGPLRSRIVWGSTAPFFDLEAQLGEFDALRLPAELKNAILSEAPATVLKQCGILLKKPEQGTITDARPNRR